MPIGRPPGQPPREPKRNYLDTMHRVMRGMGQVGKEIARGGPSAKEQMGKKYGKHYRGFQGKMWMHGRRGEARAGVGKYLSGFQRKLAALKIAGKGSKRKFQPGRFGLREEEIKGIAYEGWLEHLGKKKADMLLKSQGLDSSHSKYRGGREVRVEEGERELMRTPGLSREDKYIAREILRGAQPVSYEATRPERYEFTQEENVQVAEEIGKELGSKAQELYEKSWGVEKLSTPGKNEASSAPRSRWRVSPSMGWGKRSSGDSKS